MHFLIGCGESTNIIMLDILSLMSITWSDAASCSVRTDKALALSEVREIPRICS